MDLVIFTRHPQAHVILPRITPIFDLAQFALCFAAALFLAGTSGPGIFYVAALTLAGGRPEGIASAADTGFGGMAHVLAGSLGISAIISQARICSRR